MSAKDIIELIKEIFDVFANLGNTELLKDITNYQGGFLWNTVTNLTTSVFEPIGYALCSAFFLSEVIGLIERFDQVNGMTGVELPMKILVKYTLCYLTIGYSTEIIQTIIDIATDLSTSITAYSNSNLSGIDYGQLEHELNELDLLGRIGMYINLFLYRVISLGLSWATSFIYYGRLFELLILTAVSPIALSFFASDKLSQSAINFLKYAGSVALQGVIILTILYLFFNILGSGIKGANTLAELQDAVNSVMIFGGILVLCLFKSSSWAKKVMDVM